MTMIISHPQLCTILPIWFPKYHVKEDPDSWEVWPLVSKVNYASPVVIVKFTKAKHLEGQRFCIKRQDIEKCEIGTNGKAPVYKVPFNMLESYQTAQEVYDLATNIFED